MLAYLLGRLEVTISAWEGLDLAEEPDPLIEAILGEVWLERHQPALAYPRLLRAVEEFEDVGFILVNAADAARQVGDLGVARRLLDAAQHATRLNSNGTYERVLGDLLVSLGDPVDARVAYEAAPSGHPNRDLSYARLLVSEGEVERAIGTLLPWVFGDRILEDHVALAHQAMSEFWDRADLIKQQPLLAVALQRSDPQGIPGLLARQLCVAVDTLEQVVEEADKLGEANSGTYLEPSSSRAVAPRLRSMRVTRELLRRLDHVDIRISGYLCSFAATECLSADCAKFPSSYADVIGGCLEAAAGLHHWCRQLLVEPASPSLRGTKVASGQSGTIARMKVEASLGPFPFLQRLGVCATELKYVWKAPLPPGLDS